jgi:hypothetical protein
VFIFIYGHSEQAQVLDSNAGAGIIFLCGTASFILNKMPASVATIKVEAEAF